MATETKDKRWRLKGTASEKQVDCCRDESLSKAAWDEETTRGWDRFNRISELKLGKKQRNYSLHVEEHHHGHDREGDLKNATE